MNTPSFVNKVNGFSLVELMVVVAIIAIIFGAALPAYQGYRDSALLNSVRADISEYRTEMERDYAANGFQYSPPNIELADYDDGGYSITVTYFDVNGATVNPPVNAQSYIVAAKPIDSGHGSKGMTGKGAFTLTSAGILCFSPNSDSPLITAFGDINSGNDDAPGKCPKQF